MEGVNAVLHTASLHKPHVITHSRQDFIDTNITGTLNLLEEPRRPAFSPLSSRARPAHLAGLWRPRRERPRHG
jgi:nucleoside-diphosphate-sugar epimerase